MFLPGTPGRPVQGHDRYLLPSDVEAPPGRTGEPGGMNLKFFLLNNS